ncbi:MAG: caspase family protein [Pseudomonadota bacterium]
MAIPNGRCWLVAALMGSLLLTGSSVWAKNYALLIGNSNYSIGQLDNPSNDARDLARVLKDIGFETSVRLDGDAEGMKAAIRDFGAKLSNNDGIGLFFFAGHGVQVNGENYLLPVGYPFRSEADVEKAGVPANLVLRYMEDSKNRVNVVVLDACRNNPFIKTRSLKSRGLAPMDAPSGSLVAFSTAPGTEASDGSGNNGLYTKHLMANLKVPGLTVEQVFKRTREGVETESEREIGRRQSPREESSLKGADMYFVPPPEGGAGTANAAAVELAYWNSITSSTNPADFESYLNQYPQGQFAALARNRLQALRNSQTAARGESRAATEGTVASSAGGSAPAFAPPRPQVAARPASGVFGSSSGFKFSDHEGGNAIKAAEFLSISCRDVIRNKRVRLQLDDRSGGGAVVRQSLEGKLRSVGVKIAAGKQAADLIVRGVIESSQGVNRMLGINEVDLSADFTLLLSNGNAVAAASASGGSFAGGNTKQAIRALWDEKSEEVIGQLFNDYCAE